MLHDRNDKKITGKSRKHIKYDYTIKVECHYNDMHGKYLYEVDYPDGKNEQVTDNIIE